MLNIIELEQRWFKYKIKYYLPYIVITIALFIITLSVFSFLILEKNPELEENKKLPKKTHIEAVAKEQVYPSIYKEPVKLISPKREKITLAPSLDFMKKMQNAQQPQYMQNERVATTEKKEKTTPKVALVSIKQVEEKEPVNIIKVHKINIKRQQTDNDIYEIITRFKKNNNPALSLFVAKKYYEMKNYNQAYNYALITNNINSNIESSWIIFAKSLVKLKKKDQAIRTLNEYIMQSHSNSAQILRDEIRSGEFQ
jgi:hypothetical protein